MQVLFVSTIYRKVWMHAVNTSASFPAEIAQCRSDLISKTERLGFCMNAGGNRAGEVSVCAPRPCIYRKKLLFLSMLIPKILELEWSEIKYPPCVFLKTQRT